MKFTFSVQGLDLEVYWQVMRLKLDNTLRKIEHFVELKEQGNYKLPKVNVVMLDTTEIHDQLPHIRQYWQARGVKIRIHPLENRANHRKILSNAIAVRDLQPFDWCNRLYNQIYVLYDGRMVQCYADWEQSSIMGDLSHNMLYDIWHGPCYSELRKRFLAGNITSMNQIYPITTERVEGAPLLLTQIERRGPPALLDVHFPTHGNRQDVERFDCTDDHRT